MELLVYSCMLGFLFNTFQFRKHKGLIYRLQLNYADMLKRVEPLRNELQKLEDDAKDNQQKANEVEQMIRDLEASIARYKEEYAVLISEAQAIKADLAAVEAKVRPFMIFHSFTFDSSKLNHSSKFLLMSKLGCCFFTVHMSSLFHP